LQQSLTVLRFQTSAGPYSDSDHRFIRLHKNDDFAILIEIASHLFNQKNWSGALPACAWNMKKCGITNPGVSPSSP